MHDLVRQDERLGIFGSGEALGSGHLSGLGGRELVSHDRIGFLLEFDGDVGTSLLLPTFAVAMVKGLFLGSVRRLLVVGSVTGMIGVVGGMIAIGHGNVGLSLGHSFALLLSPRGSLENVEKVIHLYGEVMSLFCVGRGWIAQQLNCICSPQLLKDVEQCTNP